VDHRTALATFRTLARRTGTTAGRTALTVVREVSTRIAERRSPQGSTPPGAEPRARTVVPAAPPAAPRTRRTAASPADVARAVSHNAAGLARTNPQPQRRQPVRRSAPGAKLPARAGQGILGV
jgi:hypothetical protein